MLEVTRALVAGGDLPHEVMRMLCDNLDVKASDPSYTPP